MPSDCGRFDGDSLTLHAWWTFTIDQESAVLWSVGAGSALWGAIKMGATAREGLTPVRVLNPHETQTANLPGKFGGRFMSSADVRRRRSEHLLPRWDADTYRAGRPQMPGWSTRRRPSHQLFVIDDPSVRSSRRQVPCLRHNSSPQQGCLLGTRRPEPDTWRR